MDLDLGIYMDLQKTDPSPRTNRSTGPYTGCLPTFTLKSIRSQSYIQSYELSEFLA